MWKLVSIRVRSKDADWKGFNKCYTCGVQKPWKELQAGHYIHDKLDFNLDNLKPQCVRCNKWLSGNLGIYGEKLIAEHGLKWVQALRKEAIRRGNLYTYKEVETLIEEFK